MFFLLLSGLQIFNARPNLYIGPAIGVRLRELHSRHLCGQRRRTARAGRRNCSGRCSIRRACWGSAAMPQNPIVHGLSGLGDDSRPIATSATGRVVHFFFAWILVGTLVHLADQRAGDRASVARHHPQAARSAGAAARHRRLTSGCASTHGRTYSPLQKLAYFGVFVIVFPLIIADGADDVAGTWTRRAPWLLDLFGGRQTARTIHFFCDAGVRAVLHRPHRSWWCWPARSTNCAR